MADFTQYDTDSVEWLVDNSDVIAVVNYEKDPDRGHNGSPEILKVLKGDSKTLRWPLIPVERKRNEIRFGPREQDVCLVYVKGSHALLQEVPLLRERQSFSGPVPLVSMVYGVTQTGELIVTQSSLMQAINRRISAPLRKSISVFRTPLTENGMYAPNWFPLNTNSQFFVVKVPWDTHYRDAMIHLSTSGDAAQRMYAAFVLSHFDDATAKKALENLSQVEAVDDAYAHRKEYADGYITDLTLSASDVRHAAERALEEIESRKASE